MAIVLCQDISRIGKFILFLKILLCRLKIYRENYMRLTLIWMLSQIGPQHPETQHVAISHHGLRLIKRTPNGDLIILETLPLEDIVSVNSSRAGVCVLQIASGVRLPLHTNRAPQLAEMIGKYIRLVSGGSLSFSLKARARPRLISDGSARKR